MDIEIDTAAVKLQAINQSLQNKKAHYQMV